MSINYRHVHGQPCPVVGEGIPESIWTNHKKPGCYNACKHCEPENDMTPAERLAKLRDKREKE